MGLKVDGLDEGLRLGAEVGDMVGSGIEIDILVSAGQTTMFGVNKRFCK